MSILTIVPFLFLLESFCLPSLAIKFIDKNECGKSKGCFFKPSNCDPATNCTVALSYVVENENVKFQLSAQIRIQVDSSQGQYAALGFSDDQTMGDDFVTHCIFVKDIPSKTVIGVGYNEKSAYGQTHRNIEDAHVSDYVKLEDSGAIDKIFVCQWEQKIQPNFSNNNAKPLNKPYYLFLVTGTADLQKNQLTVHNTDSTSKWYPAISTNKIDVTSKSFN